mmetsp:Transcript_4332/g.12128  ORF Transcript_4332/g.12128 Transcript_4332/m.12128 type:complete len:305 (+) Transcript_4332:45-959(+)
MGLGIISRRGGYRIAMAAEGKREGKCESHSNAATFFQGGKRYDSRRPDYPDRLYQTLLHYCENVHTDYDAASPARSSQLCVDLGCGTGQATFALAERLGKVKVVGLDGSEKQVEVARSKAQQMGSPVEFRCCSVFNTGLDNDSVSLVTVAQALHWFQPFDEFFRETQRILRPNGVFAAWTYGIPSLDLGNEEYRAFHNMLHEDGYWDSRRLLVDRRYAGIPVPFENVERAELTIERSMSLEDFLDYVRTFSATKAYADRNGSDGALITSLEKTLRTCYGAPANNPSSSVPLHISWPVTLIMGHT